MHLKRQFSLEQSLLKIEYLGLLIGFNPMS